MSFASEGLPVRLKDAGAFDLVNDQGDTLCQVSRDKVPTLKAVGRLDSTQVKVELSALGCPPEGFLDTNSLRPYNEAGQEDMIMRTSGNLVLRGGPDPDADELCVLDSSNIIEITEENIAGAASPSWVEVKISNPKSGCPSEGFVNGQFLESTQDYSKLPQIETSQSEAVSLNDLFGSVTEAGNAECLNNDCAQDAPLSASTEDLRKISTYVSPWLNGVREMIRNPKANPASLTTSRGLVLMPVGGKTKKVGLCGSLHYNPDVDTKGKLTDAYANPLTACTFASVLQDWKKNNCPGDESGCKIAWGDISHPKDKKFNRHQTHTHGECIDIRPLRKGPFVDAGLAAVTGKEVCVKRAKKRVWIKRKKRYENHNVCVQYKAKTAAAYDQEMTKTLVGKLRAAGGEPILFNDTSIGTRHSSGHNDHIHVCFKDNPKTRAACNDFVPDPAICDMENP